jgi:hypothetical protein
MKEKAQKEREYEESAAKVSASMHAGVSHQGPTGRVDQGLTL